MCGILGIISDHDDSILQYMIKGLKAIEERGKNSSGVLGFNSDSNLFDVSVKGVGPSSSVFSDPSLRREYYHHLKSEVPPKEEDRVRLEEIIKYFSRRVMIGHNRYSTAGSNLLRDAQPLLIKRAHLAGAHNGQVLNIVELKEKLEYLNWNWKTECDVEPLLTALGQSILNEKTKVYANNSKEFFNNVLVPAVRNILVEEGDYYVNGAYSVVAYVMDGGMLAFRDTRGIRPLSMASHIDGKNIFAFASETSAFNIMPLHFNIREVSRGELVFIDNELNEFSTIIHQEKPAFCSFEPNYIAAADSEFFRKKVYDMRLDLGNAVAVEYIKDRQLYDCAMPMPETAKPTAIRLASIWGLEYREGLIKRRGSVRTFQEPTQEERERAIDENFIFVRSQIEGKRIALVDDSIVRGTTMAKLLDRMFELGAEYVGVYLTYDMIQHPCFYGVDTPEEQELIAARHKGDLDKIIEDITSKINNKYGQGKVSIKYLPHTLFGPSIEVPQEDMCFACVNGKYPTKTSDYEDYLQLRIKERAKQGQ